MTAAAALGDSTGGVWTRRQALAVMTPGRVHTALRRGEWQVLWPAVFTDAGHVPDHDQRAWAAALAGGRGAVAAGRTAARVHGMVLIDDQDPATGTQEHLVDDVALPVARPALAQGQRRLLRHGRRGVDVAGLPSGLLVASVEQTVGDCARLLATDALVCLLDDLLHREVLTLEQLDALARQRRWEPGGPALRQALSRADGRSESPAETLARLLLLPVLPGLVPQHRLTDQRGWVLARFDLADPALRLAVEADGSTHRGDRSAAKDQRRDRRSDALGWRTERCTWWDLRRGHQVLRARVLHGAREQIRRHRLPYALPA
ncbi:MAG: hypothetical protein JWM62_1499 [Frankiales bacterium]|nr:hypothetical protein [Frankiales bacterium]